MSSTRCGTQEPVRPPALGVLGGLRWTWRQLTSMRTALFLLFLLAVAAVPGSVFPQRGVAPLRVGEYFQDHPTLAPILDKVSLFDVYAAPWFAAIYLLLLVSLAGCILPRCLQYARKLRAKPPAHPRNLGPAARARERRARPDVDEAAQSMPPSGAALRAVSASTAGSRWHMSVAAEKGYLHEFGNLVFHSRSVVILLGVAWGSLFGYRGTVVVVEGEGFANILTQYDDFVPGRGFRPAMLAPFSFTLDDFDAKFLEAGPRRGQPDRLPGQRDLPRSPRRGAVAAAIAVNKPLNGRRRQGLPARQRLRARTSRCVTGTGTSSSQGRSQRCRRTRLSPRRLRSRCLTHCRSSWGSTSPSRRRRPTEVDPSTGPRSVFPEDDDPRVYLGAWAGDLGLDAGVPQNVYAAGHQRNGADRPEGPHCPARRGSCQADRGSITFDGLSEFGNFQVAHDPGGSLVLLGAVAAILGIMASLLVKRRRVWVACRVRRAGSYARGVRPGWPGPKRPALARRGRP